MSLLLPMNSLAGLEQDSYHFTADKRVEVEEPLKEQVEESFNLLRLLLGFDVHHRVRNREFTNEQTDDFQNCVTHWV